MLSSPIVLLCSVFLLSTSCVDSWTVPSLVPIQSSHSPMSSTALNANYSPDRRQALLAASWTSILTSASGAASASANTDLNADSSVFVRRDINTKFAYQFQPPVGATQTGKPLKTHLDEVNFKVTDTSIQFGITVDPVRINSLRDFGTPEEVAAKVVLAEVNRDGVTDVTLVLDPQQFTSQGVLYYELNYLSVGKRGPKHFVARFAIAQQKLYTITAQCKEDDYKNVQSRLQSAVESFAVLTP